jgi:hypothetical protein
VKAEEKAEEGGEHRTPISDVPEADFRSPAQDAIFFHRKIRTYKPPLF